MNKIAAFTEILAQDPANAFARYGLAMEFVNQADSERALEEFAALIKQHPDYVPGYQMAGQLLLKLNQKRAAREWVSAGLAAAKRTGNLHAQSELSALLDETGDERGQ